MTQELKIPKKLIEVALPLDAINVASAREKSIRHGHPSTLHLWWARRPLAAARAVIFAQMVNDPSWKWEMEHPGEIPPSQMRASWAASRKRIFGIIEELVKWESTTNDVVLEKARAEIYKSWREVCELNKDHPQATELFNPEKLPAFHDPFAGGGALPLEAQRLGLESYASDLNPVAVTINKAMIEIPPRFSGRKPVGPIPPGERQTALMEDWSGAKGLAEDVRRYGAWMRAEAQQRIGHLYPQVEITAEMAKERPDLKPLLGEKLTVIAWLWARTVKSPNPAYSHVDVPLASTFVLSSKEGKENYVHPIVKGDTYRFAVKVGAPPEEAMNGTAAGKRGGFHCLISNSPIDYDYIRAEGTAGRMSKKLMAIVAEGTRGRIYITPTSEHETIARSAQPKWKPNAKLHGKCRVNVSNYGLDVFGDLFTSRQLVALTTFSDLVTEAIAKAKADALAAGLAGDDHSLDKGGTGATAYAEAVGVYLSLASSKLADSNSEICTWMPGVKYEVVRTTFSRQALPMTWDFAESNPFAESSGDLYEHIKRLNKFFELSCSHAQGRVGVANQQDAQNSEYSINKLISTDPPYYDNISYADLSDFFYVWLSRSLKHIYPSLFAASEAPKVEELVATPYRHGGKEQAEKFFLDGMTTSMHHLVQQAHPAFPVTIYYAFKQSETTNEAGTSSTGWETFLEAVLKAGFSLTGTWPMRTERDSRSIGIGTNALASSIVLVCRQRHADAATTSRREFIRKLNTVLPEALSEMTQGTGDGQSPIAPVDLSQAIIGPGMAIFSKYSAVLEADGKPMSVKTALQLINRFIAEDDFDHDTQFCLSWFDGHGWDQGRFGEADVLARAKGTSVDGLKSSGVVESSAGTLRLLRPLELPGNWTPDGDNRISVWEILHNMIHSLSTEGETGAGDILSKISRYSENIRTLAYRLYTLCERKGWAQDAGQYNTLILAWDGIEAAARLVGYTGTQADLFGESNSKESESKLTKKKTTRKKK
ncbi:MAG: DUF1156 domain-containing protein [Bdellovibrionales bacterium]|nr:DUF1156 domain-containing protein [Bdellovibrionales bacterium]